MTEAFPFLRRPGRENKPRRTGVTMVLDKGMSVEELELWLPVNAPYVDLVKFGWCTAAVMDQGVIARKCELLREASVEVCPGGTLMELAHLQGKVPQFLEEARRLGFSCIEVSNGTVPMTDEEKRKVIAKAIDLEFRVVSEVGSKITEEDQRLHIEERIEMTQAELESGVWKVIMEARESGTHGIFDLAGKTHVDMLQTLIKEVRLESLIFEAPLKSQQADLIHRLGNAVNLGNIPPSEVIPLETLRLGFRGDTLRQFHIGLPSVTLGLGAGDALAASKRGDVVVVVDPIRAASTVVTALANGVRAVVPVATAEECVGEVTCGERGGKKIPQVDLDNSPLAFSTGKYSGKKVVWTATNGTECIMAAASDARAIVLIGSLLNATAVAQCALESARTSGRNISIVMAGRNNQLATEDLIAASEIAFQLKGAPIQGEYSLVSSENFVVDFLTSDSGRNLSVLGRSEDIIFCAQKDLYEVVPMFKEGELVLAGA